MSSSTGMSRSNDTIVAGLSVHKASLQEEMATFDELGPEAKRALQHAPLKVSAHGIISSLSPAAFMFRGHPKIDTAIAQKVQREIEEKMNGSK